MQETGVRSPDWEDSPGEGKQQPAPVFLPWRISWTEEPGGLHSPWGQEELDTTEHAHTHTHTHTHTE